MEAAEGWGMGGGGLRVPVAEETLRDAVPSVPIRAEVGQEPVVVGVAQQPHCVQDQPEDRHRLEGPGQGHVGRDSTCDVRQRGGLR